jgi:hypothetical protein
MEKSSVIKFIEGMTKGHEAAMDEVFAHGYCYWFAKILELRFDGEMWYLPVENHWVTKIGDHFFDVNGEYEVGDGIIGTWHGVAQEDPLLAERLRRDCILKEEV